MSDNSARERTAAAATSIDGRTLADTYIYLLGRALVVRQEMTDRGGEGFAFNRIKYNPLGTADFVNPNFDVAYLEAWVAVDPETPAILEVPEVTGRYYTAQILDEWGEVIANINERTFPSKPFGKFALVYPGSSPAIPADAGRIELHSSKAKLLGRVEIKGDPDGALALQRAFTLRSTGTPAIADPPPQPMFGNKGLIGVELFDHADAILSSALDVSPIAASKQQAVRAIAQRVAGDMTARAAVDKMLRETIVPEFEVYATTKAAPYLNHWIGGGPTGNYGSEFRFRTVVNFVGIWGNTPGEVIYFMATRDSEERVLDGGNGYVIHFGRTSCPRAWSMPTGR